MEENYEWDEDKRCANLEKHGVDFKDVFDFDWNTASSAEDLRSGEVRFVASGYIGERLHVIVYTERGQYENHKPAQGQSARGETI